MYSSQTIDLYIYLVYLDQWVAYPSPNYRLDGLPQFDSPHGFAEDSWMGTGYWPCNKKAQQLACSCIDFLIIILYFGVLYLSHRFMTAPSTESCYRPMALRRSSGTIALTKTSLLRRVSHSPLFSSCSLTPLPLPPKRMDLFIDPYTNEMSSTL